MKATDRHMAFPHHLVFFKMGKESLDFRAPYLSLLVRVTKCLAFAVITKGTFSLDEEPYEEFLAIILIKT